LVWAACRGSSEGRLVTYVLSLDGVVIAALIGRVDPSRVEALTTVYDAAYSRYAPGKLLLSACLNWAFCESLEFDLRGGDFSYKRRWANEESLLFNYKIGNSTIYALGLRLPSTIPLLRWYRKRLISAAG
jgi:CelD/BcsL family acetyltransferase involved in cellulose biosynthesis